MKKTYNSFNEIKDANKSINKPLDFDKFWAKQLEKVKNIDLNIKLEKAIDENFEKVELYYLSFDSFDGTRVYCKYLRPKVDGNTPLILQFHGYPGASRSFFELSSYTQKGISVLAMDCRGQGGRTLDKGGSIGPTVCGHIINGLLGDMEDHIYVKIFLDTYLVYEVAKELEDIDEDRIYASGSSQGAALAIVCASLHKEIKKIALLYPFLSDYKKVFELEYDEIAYEGLRYYSRWFDPTGENLDKTFDKLAYIDVSNFAGGINADVIYGISLADQVCPPLVQASVYKQISSNKKLYTFKGFGHEKICSMEEKLIPFFLEDESLNSDYLPNIEIENLNIKVNILRYMGHRKCLLYLNPSIEMKSFYFRRFLNLGYDVYGLICNKNYNEDTIDNLVKYLCNKYDGIVIMAYREFANYTLKVTSNKKIKALILQGLIEEKDIFNKINISCKKLIATLGIDEMTSEDFNGQLVEKLDNLEYYHYPRYMYERINDFEDRKMQFLNKL